MSMARGRSAGRWRRPGARSRSRRLSRIGSRWVRGESSDPAPTPDPAPTTPRPLVAISLSAGEVGPKAIAAGPATDDEGHALETVPSLFHQGLPKLELPRFRGPAVWPHPRLRAMCERFQPEKLAVPWLAPSMPWWPLGGRWAGAPSEKVLLFSRFRAVPRTVAGLMSYDLERHLLRRSGLRFRDVTKRSPLGPQRENLRTFIRLLPSHASSTRGGGRPRVSRASLAAPPER